MLTLPPSTRVFVATKPADMRRSFDGLLALVRDFLGQDPFAGHLFVFRNRSGDRLKVLYWEADGLCLFYKKQDSDYTHPWLFTECDQQPYNRALRLAATDRMDSSAFRGSRRCLMSRSLNAIAPPRAHSGRGQRSCSRCGVS